MNAVITVEENLLMLRQLLMNMTTRGRPNDAPDHQRASEYLYIFCKWPKDQKNTNVTCHKLTAKCDIFVTNGSYYKQARTLIWLYSHWCTKTEAY